MYTKLIDTLHSLQKPFVYRVLFYNVFLTFVLHLEMFTVRMVPSSHVVIVFEPFFVFLKQQLLMSSMKFDFQNLQGAEKLGAQTFRGHRENRNK